jgi:hypothetical protein
MKRLGTADWLVFLVAVLTFAVVVSVLAQNFLGIE